MVGDKKYRWPSRRQMTIIGGVQGSIFTLIECHLEFAITAIISLEQTGNSRSSKEITSQQTSSMVNKRGNISPKGKGIIGKSNTRPIESQSTCGCLQKEECGHSQIYRLGPFGRCPCSRNAVRLSACLKRKAYRASWHGLVFVGSTVRGRTINGGSTTPTFPNNEMAPDFNRAMRVPSTKVTKDLHDTLFLNTFIGGSSESYDSPLKLPLKCLKNGWIETLSLIHQRICACCWDGLSCAMYC